MIAAENIQENVSIEPVRLNDIDGVTELVYKMPPTAWIDKISRRSLRKFLEHSASDSRSVLLAARRAGEDTIAAYIFSILEPKRFWLGFAIRYPAAMASIMFYHLRRVIGRNLERKKSPPAVGGDSSLPFFSWSPGGPGNARIMSIYVRNEYSGRKGIATSLYLKLFEALKGRGCSLVEEYMRPDDLLFAGKFPEACGWQVQQCRDGGYKIFRQL